MSKQDTTKLHQQIDKHVKAAVSQAIERHRKLEEAIAVWQEGRVVVLSAEEIPQIQKDSQVEGGNDV